MSDTHMVILTASTLLALALLQGVALAWLAKALWADRRVVPGYRFPAVLCACLSVCHIPIVWMALAIIAKERL